MKIKFEKYHGLGNDFIFISHKVLKNFKTSFDIKIFAQKICHRHHAIGADGVVFFKFAQNKKRFEILILNSDGSFAATCGNALRCVGLKLFRDSIWDGKEPISIFRLAPKHLLASLKKNYVIFDTQSSFATIIKLDKKKSSETTVTIKFAPPVCIEKYEVKNLNLKDSFSGDAIFVQLENPHLVFFAENFRNFDFPACIEFGKSIQQSVNVNVGLLNPQDTLSNIFKLRVYERGAGLTTACGSGAVAAMYALWFLNVLKKDNATFEMPGGSIKIGRVADLYKNSILQNSVELSACANFSFAGEF